jgi:hypothetical protein
MGRRREGQRVERNEDRQVQRSHGRRGVAAFAVGAAALVGALLCAPVAGAQTDAPEDSITISAEPAASQGACAPGGDALTYEAIHDEQSFTLRITSAAPRCEPIDAVAAIYTMPGNGIAWPQQLAEARPFTISEAGTVDVRFAKGCEPVQFDVLTGATPDLVAPWGDWHGPLLFPFDVDTTYQHWGAACPDGPTPTSTTTTTAPPVEPDVEEPVDGPVVEPVDETTSTTAPDVLGSTEDPPPSGGDPQVLGVTQEAEPASLAFTGMSFRILGVAGLSLFLAGVAIAALGRRNG